MKFMKSFRRLADTATIQAKLVGIGLITAGTATLMIGLILIVGVFYQQRARMLDHLQIQAVIAGANSTAALSFTDTQGATDILSTLQASPSIQGAAIYDEKHQLFATFKRDAFQVLPLRTPDLPDGVRLGYAQLEVLSPITLNGSQIGAVYLHSSLSALYAYLFTYALMCLIAALAALVVATLLLSRLQRSVTVPLRQLSRLVDQVATSPDYSVRANVVGRDEVAMLAFGINTMLERIQTRDQDLEREIRVRRSVEENILRLNETLEERVRERSFELEAERNFISSVLDMTSAQVLVLQADGTVISGNRAAGEAIGFTQQQLRQIPMWKLFSIPEEAERLRARFDARNGEIDKFEGTWITPAGGHIIISWRFTKLQHVGGSAASMIATGNDITSQKLIEDALQQAKQVAEDASRSKSEFLANMSHEIRTPMNAIMGMTHLALQTELNPKQRNYMEKVDSAAKGLLGIINDILDFSKIEAGKVCFEKVDFLLEDVLENLADLSVMKAQDKGLELLFDIGADVPVEMVGDPLRLGQVLINLVSNAIKFTESGEVIVSVRRLPPQPRPGGGMPDANQVALRFAITDTGVGLTEEQQVRLFSAFSQADSTTTRKYGGTGLGLSISKSLVEMMAGTIGVQSVHGAGSTFFFSATFGLQTEHRRDPGHPENLRGIRILVVDDNASAREIILSMLDSIGFQALAVDGGAAALLELEQGQREGQAYGLVLVDWQMAGLDGIETIQRIQSHQGLDRMPTCIMVTAYSREELQKMARQAHIRVDGLLLKPLSPSKLFDSIMTVFGKHVERRHAPRHQRQVNSQIAEKSLRGAVILLVEDNEMNREVAVDILNAAGMRVDVACDGLEALEMVGVTDYDGVLMDCQMPLMDGFEVTQRIRADGRFDHLPVIAMTANAMAGDREKCIEAGMNDHIAKPLDVAQLFSTMARWIKSRGPAIVDEPAIMPQALAALANIAGLDSDTALLRVGGSVVLYNKMLALFYQGQSETVAQIRGAITGGERQKAARLCHTLRGLSGNIGAQDLADAMEKLERAIDTLQDAVAQTLLVKADALLSSVMEDIRQALPLIGIPLPADARHSLATGLVDVDNALPLLRQLAQMLTENAADATEQLEPLAVILQGSIAEDPFRHISRLVERYEFDESLTLLCQLAEKLEISLD